MLRLTLLFVATSAWLVSCATGPHLPAEIPASTAPGSDLQTVVILGTNDIHGALAPIPTKTTEAAGTESVPYEWGGAAVLASHIRVLRQQFGARLLYLDGGDEFQGSVESNAEEGAPMVSFFNAIGLQAAAIGNHEFDFGPIGPEGTSGDLRGALKARISEARYPFLSANTFDQKGRYPGIPGTSPSALIDAGGVKVGVIGITTRDTPVTTRHEFVADLEFKDPAEITVREAKSLRERGAQVIVLVAHAGLKCERPVPTDHTRVRKPGDAQGDCNERSEIVRLLSDIPAGTVDAVVSGHTHTVVHHFVRGVPVIQGGNRAQVYNLIYLTYDRVTGKVRPELSRIEGPIPVCGRVFANQGDCNGDAAPPRNGRGRLTTARLHGVAIEPDPEISQLLAPIFAKSKEEKSRIVGEAGEKLAYVRTHESPLGNLVADAVRAKAKTEMALVNAGGIRAEIDSGPITYESVFRVLPFDNSIMILDVTGRQLKTLLRVAESGARGWFPVSGLRLKLIDLPHDAPITDLNKNGKLEPWEANRLLEARLDDGKGNGKLIDDSRIYHLATIDFLVTGGDDMGWAMSQIPDDHKHVVPGGLMREAIAEYLAAHRPIHTAQAPLVDPEHPRIVAEKPPAKAKGRSRGRRRRKH
jgi:5'-nucleotidase